jgi:hypothetical protein
MTKHVCALFAVAGISAATPAVAGNIGADEARRFVVGSLFSFTCFEGTTGEGRVNADGSVGGVVRLGGSGLPQYATLPCRERQLAGAQDPVRATVRDDRLLAESSKLAKDLAEHSGMFDSRPLAIGNPATVFSDVRL